MPVTAQTNPGASAFQNQFPDPLDYRPPVEEPPELYIVSVEQIELPGPLVSGPRLVDGMIEVHTSKGLVRTAWTAGAVPAINPAGKPPAEPAPPEWAVSADGTHRSRPLDHRILMVQKACPSCATGWRRRWRLRVAGLAQVSPVVTKRRVYYGSADNQVYGVRRKNGHRAWVTPVDGRVLRPMALWVDQASATAALLVIPEPGSELVVLDAVGGRPSFTYRLPREDERFVGPAVSTPDGRIVLARQGYSPSDAGLVVLEIGRRPQETAQPGAIPVTGYNPPTSDEPIPARPLPDIRASFVTSGSLL